MSKYWKKYKDLLGNVHGFKWEEKGIKDVTIKYNGKHVKNHSKNKVLIKGDFSF